MFQIFLIQVFINLMRRHKYLEKMFEEEMRKVLVFIKGFTPSERVKLARMTALWIGKWIMGEHIYIFFLSIIISFCDNNL